MRSSTRGWPSCSSMISFLFRYSNSESWIFDSSILLRVKRLCYSIWNGSVDGKQFCKWRAKDLPAEVGASLGGSRNDEMHSVKRSARNRLLEYSLDKFQLMKKGSSVASISSNGPFNFYSESTCYTGCHQFLCVNIVFLRRIFLRGKCFEFF